MISSLDYFKKGLKRIKQDNIVLNDDLFLKDCLKYERNYFRTISIDEAEQCISSALNEQIGDDYNVKTMVILKKNQT